jgi:hypothetical protein
MSKRAGFILLAAFLVLFLALNHDAYRGWFQDDEIDNLGWAPSVSSFEFLKATLSPLFQPNNFRPVAHYYFHAVDAIAGLDFPVYLAVLQGFHLLNVWLLWLIVRRLGATPTAAAAACAFFGLHGALFDNLWKPMYIFDVTCATFSLASLVLWLRGRWIWSFAAFWLAYKCKELAVMLPLVLVAVELLAAPGERKLPSRQWKRLIPFFAVSLSFGLQSLRLNPNPDSDYIFRFNLAALVKTGPFYAGRVFLVPYLGFLVPLLLLTRSRRAAFGLAAMALLFFPLLFLPGRIYSAYCYLPFTGLAIALSALPPATLVLFVVLWFPMDIHAMRMQRRETLARDDQVRTWMAAVEDFADAHNQVDAFVFEGAPEGFNRWGIEGALHYFYQRSDLAVSQYDEPEAQQWMATRRVALIQWDAARRRADVRVIGPRLTGPR